MKLLSVICSLKFFRDFCIHKIKISTDSKSLFHFLVSSNSFSSLSTFCALAERKQSSSFIVLSCLSDILTTRQYIFKINKVLAIKKLINLTTNYGSSLFNQKHVWLSLN